jgi:hypothetical protein
MLILLKNESINAIKQINNFIKRVDIVPGGRILIAMPFPEYRLDFLHLPGEFVA